MYEATVEALYLALRARGEQPEALKEVGEHRARLGHLDELLSQLGWPAEPLPNGAELTGPADVLHDALHGVLIDAGERLATACERSWRGAGDTESVQRAARDVIALDRLLQELED
jgi:hypothetical protein